MASFSIAQETKSDTITETASGVSGFSFSAGVLKYAIRAFLSVDQPVRVAYGQDSPTATATFGHPIAADATMEILGAENIRSISVIRTTGSSANATMTIETASKNITTNYGE